MTWKDRNPGREQGSHSEGQRARGGLLGERGDKREKGEDQTGLPGTAGKEERGPRGRVWRIGEFRTKLRPESREERKQSSGERAAAERKKGAKGEGEN